MFWKPEGEEIGLLEGVIHVLESWGGSNYFIIILATEIALLEGVFYVLESFCVSCFGKLRGE